MARKQWEVTHSGRDVCRTDITNVLDAAFAAASALLLPDDAHILLLYLRFQGGLVCAKLRQFRRLTQECSLYGSVGVV